MSRARWALFVLFSAGTACACLNGSDYTGGPTDSAEAGPADGASRDGESRSDAGPGDAGAGDAGTDARTIPAAATIWIVNGHGYEIVFSQDITWDEAKVAAEALGGHLATVVTMDENLFVWNLVRAHPEVQSENAGPWIGGRQADGAAEPGGGWGWITGEPWSYTAWTDTEPNDDVHNENCLGYLNGPQWADYREDATAGPGYVVEYEP